MNERIVIDVDRDGWTKGLQLNIAQLDETNTGTGYRLAGPKYNGSSKNLLRCELDARDAREIREALDAVFPQTATGVADPICTQIAARAAGLDIAPTTAELTAMAHTIVTAAHGAPTAEVDLARVMPLLCAELDRLRVMYNAASKRENDLIEERDSLLAASAADGAS